MAHFAKIDRLSEVSQVLSTKKSSALDAFKLFYEELTSSKSTTRIKRLRTVPSAK